MQVQTEKVSSTQKWRNAKEIIEKIKKVVQALEKGDNQEKYLETILKELPKDNFIDSIGKLEFVRVDKSNCGIKIL